MIKRMQTPLYFFALTVVYYFSARIGLFLEAQYGGVTPIWLPSGIAVSVFFVKGIKYWPMVVIGELAVSLTLGQSLLTGSVGGLAQTLEALLAVYMLRRMGIGRITASARSVLWFSALVALVPPVLSAAVGVSALRLLGYLAPAEIVSGFTTWWLGDTIGILVLTPVLTGLTVKPFRQIRRPLNFLLYMAVFTAVALTIVMLRDSLAYYLFFILIPFVVVSGIHFGLIGAGSAVILLAGLVFGMRSEDMLAGDYLTGIRMAFVGTSSFTGYLVTGFMERRQHRLAVIQRQKDSMTALHDISLEMMGQLAIDRLMDGLVARACTLLQTAHGYFCHWDGIGPAMEVKAGTGIYAGISGYHVKPGEGLAGKVWQEGRSMYRNDYQTWEGRHPDSIWDDVTAIIGVPIIIESRAIGVLGVLDIAADRRFAPDDVEILERFAALASIALQNATAHSSLQRAEANLRQLTTAIEFAVEEIMITDVHGTIQYVNPAFEQGTGYGRTEVIGKTPRILKSGRQNGAFYADLWQTLLRGELWTGRLVNRHKDGRLILQEANIAPIRDNAETIAGFVSIKRDITAQERIKQQLIESQKREAIGNLAAGIAHDFNNILSGIIGYTELAMRQPMPDGHPMGRYLTSISTASQRAVDLVRQILTFGRSQESQPEVVDIKPLVKEVVRLVRASLPPDVKLELTTTARHTRVSAGPTNIHQILMNLITNASQSLADGRGMIGVTLADRCITTENRSPASRPEAGDYLEIAVTDNGCGISPEAIQQVFDPYFTTKAPGEGTGLGLFVIHGIVKSLGGYVDVESGVGSGSTFRVLLPCAVKEGHKVPTAPMDLPKGTESILIVDEEPFILDSLSRQMTDLGYRVRPFRSGQEALAAFGAEPGAFDLVLTDMAMADMNGLELSRRIRDHRAEVPIVVCSGNPDAIDSRHIADLGLQKVLGKPVTLEAMAHAIRAILDRRPGTASPARGPV